MTNHQITIYADLSETSALTLEELISAAQVPEVFIQELIAYQIILPNPQQQFTLMHLNRTQTAYRLHKDLEVNIAGVAVVLDLLEEMQALREQLEFLEKQYLNNPHRD